FPKFSDKKTLKTQNGLQTPCLLILVTFVSQGYGCDRSNLTIKESKTGNLYKDVTEWEVRLTNPCPCDFKNVKLSCTGFKSVIPIDKSVLSKSGNDCLLINGQSVGYKSDYVFRYVWATSFNFKILNATSACS
ncbi:hypothetical protein N665_0004s0104, partial [Sinapis alba]